MSYVPEVPYSLEELQDSFDWNEQKEKRARDRCEALRRMIRSRGDCDHRSLNAHEEDRDNGYGRWWKVKIETCIYCGARRSDGRYWQSYEDWLKS